MNFDKNKFRQLNGEEIEPGDYWLNDACLSDEPQPVLAHHGLYGVIAHGGLRNIYLRRTDAPPSISDVISGLGTGNVTIRNPTSEAAARKATPVATGFIDYFPLAIQEVARLSKVGNDQHNPGKPLHWDRSKSGDEGDALMRHFVDRGKMDTDGVRHSAKVAWRAMALLQKELEAVR